MIDTSFDLRTDASGDADTYSPTMRRYHRLLWSKRLPGGAHDHGQEELDERNPEVAAGSVESERRSLDR